MLLSKLEEAVLQEMRLLRVLQQAKYETPQIYSSVEGRMPKVWSGI